MSKSKLRFKNFFRKGDVILLILLIFSIVITIVFATRSGADTAEIYVDGALKYELSLSSDKTIELLDGAMTVIVRDGKIWVDESNCGEQLCVHSSPIGKNGGMIVCLPNKVVIKVKFREVDAVV